MSKVPADQEREWWPNDGELLNILMEALIHEADLDQFPGAGHIAQGLAHGGTVVATQQAKGIWHGGFGNFITYGKPDGGVGVITMRLSEDIWRSEHLMSAFESATATYQTQVKILREEAETVLKKRDAAAKGFDLVQGLLKRRKQYEKHAKT